MIIDIPQREQFDMLPILRRRLSLFDMAAAHAVKGGEWAEFGVKNGVSAELLQSLQIKPTPFYLFDSWEGLPEDWIEDGTLINRRGKFRDAQPPSLPGTTNVPGFYDDTIPGFQFKGPLSLIHVDCDLESSARTVLEHVPIGVGTAIVFDEFFASRNGFTNPNGELFACGEGRAWIDEVDRRGIEWDYIARTTRNRVAIVVKSVRC